MTRFADAMRMFRLVAALAAAVVLVACGGIAPSGFSGDVEVLLARGEAYAVHLARQDAQQLEDAEILALGYHERARLGLGSPFRLIEYALRDPDLTPAIREQVAYGILARVLDQRSYHVDPTVLDRVGFFGAPDSRPAGEAQLRLIERTITAAPSATAGERAVRLGYRLASAERTAENVPHSVVSHIAAMVADRRRAAADARALLRTATRQEADPLALLQQWRRELAFRAERPSLTPLSVREEVAVARDAPQLARALRALALRLSSPTSLVDEAGDPFSGRSGSLLSGEAAARLMELSQRRDHPPQAPVAVALTLNRDQWLERPDLAPWERDARLWFSEQAWNEERLASASAVLEANRAGRGTLLPLTRLRAATFLRAWNQEEPWYPGDPAPAVKDLVGRFGLAGIEFAPEVPEQWRPYYLRVIARAFVDLQRVLPTVSLRGMSIQVGPLPGGPTALALHDPRTRTLILPPHTGAGTLAHEAAHDLDWQLARQRYGRRGGYATDLAVKDRRRDRIAASMSGLVDAIQLPPGVEPGAHDVRPAEVFARGMDWLVAAALAREGRTGGYLSSFQDPELTGYGTTRGPDVGGGAVPALLSILDAIAPVEERTREWALDSYGPARTLSPVELATGILGAGSDSAPERRLSAIVEARGRSLQSLSSASCRLSSAEGMRRLVTAQRLLIQHSAAAAAQGAALDAIRALGTERLGKGSGERIDRWLAWRLYGAPEPVDSALSALAPAFENLLYRATMVDREQRTPAANAFRTGGSAALCGGNPFAPRPDSAAGQLLAAPIGSLTWPAPGVGRRVGDHADR